MKSTLIAADTLNFRTKVPQYPPTDGWTLTYRLIPRAAGTSYTFDATADGDDYVIQVGPSTTATYAAGEYTWIAYVHKAGERYTVDQGTATIRPNLVTASAYDNRSHGRKVLESILAVIEGRATKDQMAYTIGTRQLSRMPIKELIYFRDRYRGEVYVEEQKEAAEAGQGSARVVVRL